MFMFAGRRENLALQAPFTSRILAEHPEVEFHVWNLTQCDADDEYVRAISGERTTVRNDFSDQEMCSGFISVYRHYADPVYSDAVFVKLDDDVVFLQTGSFGEFVAVARDNPEAVVSAQTMNNGASTVIDFELYEAFQGLGIRLLDVHLSGDYAHMSHTQFFERWRSLTSQHREIIRTSHWLSINAIAYNWQVARRIAEQCGGRHPRYIAGRRFHPSVPLGDEGIVNMMPRIIYRGFLACHLTFGPQLPEISAERLAAWRDNYARIGKTYLGEL